jgi:hypothetical protein
MIDEQKNVGVDYYVHAKAVNFNLIRPQDLSHLKSTMVVLVGYEIDVHQYHDAP